MFKRVLKELRIRNDLTLEELANKYNARFNAGMNKGTLSRYERGKQEPTMYVVVNFADLFGVTLDYIVGREKPIIPSEQEILLSWFKRCDQDAQTSILNYAEYQYDKSRLRRNILETSENHIQNL